MTLARLPFPAGPPIVADPGAASHARALEERLLGGARRLLRDMTWLEASPTRVLSLGRRTFDLATELPGTWVRPGTLGSAAAWRGWPDVVWCDLMLSAPGAEIPVGTTLDRLADATPAGSLVAVVEVHPATPPALARTLGLTCPGELLPGLRARFTTLHESVVGHRDGFRTVVFLGRR